MLLKKIKMKIKVKKADCEKDRRRRRRVKRAEVTLIYRLLPTLQLGLKGQNTGNPFRDTHIFFNTHTGVFFYVGSVSTYIHTFFPLL